MIIIGGTTIIHWFDKALIDHRRAIESEALRQVLDAARLRTVSYLGCGRTVELIVDAVFFAYQPFTVAVDIGASEMSLPTLLVVEFEETAQLQILLRVTKTAVAVAVPQQTIVLVGEHKGDRHLSIILEQVLALTLHIELFTLMLS